MLSFFWTETHFKNDFIWIEHDFNLNSKKNNVRLQIRIANFDPFHLNSFSICLTPLTRKL